MRIFQCSKLISKPLWILLMNQNFCNFDYSQTSTDGHPSIPWSQRFFLIFLCMRELRESCEAMKTRVVKRRERKTSSYFGLESHFHADARVRIWPSGLDWLIFLQTRKSIWLVRLICNTAGMVGISVTALLEVNFASLPGKEFVCIILHFSVYTRSRLAYVRHGLCFWQCLRRNFDFGT